METADVRRQDGRRKSVWLKIAIALAAAMLIAVIAAGVYLLNIYMEGKAQLENLGRHAGQSDDDSAIDNADMEVISGEDVDARTGYPINWVNILLLLGSDSRNGSSYGRSDAMLIASVNSKTGEIKLTSIMCDSWVKIPGKGDNKINAALAMGGPVLAMKTVNNVFEMNITKYAYVNFIGFPYIIDSIGGIELDITKRERCFANIIINDFDKSLYDAGDIKPIEDYGDNVHLNGIQALAYSRIRHADSDFVRTQRQRDVLMAVFKKVKSKGLSFDLAKSVAAVLPCVETNLATSEIISLAKIVLQSDFDKPEELRLPIDHSYKYSEKSGTSSIRMDIRQNTKALHEFIYGKYLVPES